MNQSRNEKVALRVLPFISLVAVCALQQENHSPVVRDASYILNWTFEELAEG
jgi:hypothetical protein